MEPRPGRVRIPIAWTVGLLCATGGTPGETPPPREVGLREQVEVGLVQLEVTVWPRAEDPAACLGLTAEDFELRIDGKRHPLYAVDSLGTHDEVYRPESTPLAAAARRGLSLVLLFDLWHVDLFYRGYDACTPTKHLAFEEARRFVREEFREGDRLLLVTFDGWPVIHYGWIDSGADALQAIERLESNRQVAAPRQHHIHHRSWIEGMKSLFLALGREPGRKDVLYLAEDFRFDDVALQMYDIAARAQSNGVVVSAVDLLAACRSIPGPPCTRGGGGLGCSPFRYPVALSPFSRDTGGELFRSDRIDTAVRELRASRDCRYVVSFRPPASKRKRTPSIKLSLRGERKDIALHAPSSFEPPERIPTREERDAALFLLPRFGRGIAVETTLWPYRPSDERDRWKAFVLVRVERTDDEPWPDDLAEIVVNVLTHRQSRSYGQYRKTISGDELASLRLRGATKLLLFPLDEVRPGEAIVDVTVTSDIEDVSANLRRVFEVPDPPEGGEAAPWFLSDRSVRYGDREVLAPSLDDAVGVGQSVVFLGYGCRSGTVAAGAKGKKGRAAKAVRSEPGVDRTWVGTMAPFAGGPSVPVPIAWLGSPDPDGDRCGWLVGRAAAPEQAGLWEFRPPPELVKGGTASAVEFSVLSADPAALPAEATSWRERE